MNRRLLIAAFVLMAATARAQAPPPAAALPAGSFDPLRCWWRTSAGAVRIGEVFDLTLTCAVLESESIVVVPDESRLGPAVVAVAPYELVTGTHPSDIRAGARRFFQYQYRLRLIGRDVIGKDVPLPSLAIHYRITDRVGGGAAVQGRDLVYVLPAESLHVLSLVPANARDIRDATGEDFSIAEDLVVKAGALRMGALAAGAFGMLAILGSAIAALRGRRAAVPQGPQPLATAAILRAAIGELDVVRAERDRDGWTEVLRGRALMALRIVAACALDRAPSQRMSANPGAPIEGCLVLPERPGTVRLLSSPITPRDFTLATTTGPASSRATPETQRDALREALACFGQAHYGRAASGNLSALDRALESGRDAAMEIRRAHTGVRALRQRMLDGLSKPSGPESP